MWRVVLIAAVVALTAADEGQGGGALSGLRGVSEPRLAASGIRIARLEKLIAKMKHQLEEAEKIDPEGFLDEINARIDQVVATKKPVCEDTKHDMPCGRESIECVSTLLLCDGHKDCHNGWDEDEHVCSVGPIKAGNVFTGMASWVSCRLRKDHPVQFQITGVLKSKFFGARLGVRGKISYDFDEDNHEHHEYDVKGYYVFGRKTLVLVPLDATTEHLGVVCYFRSGDDERAECKLAHEATLTKCADIHISLQHHEHK